MLNYNILTLGEKLFLLYIRGTVDVWYKPKHTYCLLKIKYSVQGRCKAEFSYRNMLFPSYIGNKKADVVYILIRCIS